VSALPGTTGELALRALADNAAAFLEHAPGALASQQPEHVHQMRVATRRLRAALRLFADVLPPQAASLSGELKWIAGRLGRVRDLDVQIRRLGEEAVGLSVGDAVVPYASWLADKRARAQAELAEALQSQRYVELADRLQGVRPTSRFSARDAVGRTPLTDVPGSAAARLRLQDASSAALPGTSAWVSDPAADRPLLEDAPPRLKRAMRRVRKLADAIDRHSSTADLHAVRIRAKRLRYTVEFYVPVYGRPAERFVRGVVALQDALGNLQDAVVSGQHIHAAVQTAAGAWPAETVLALGQILQFESHQSQDLRRQFRDAYRAVRGKDWKRLQRVM
jgi:triphosphatase